MTSELKGLSYKVSIDGLYDDYFTFSFIGADRTDITTGNISGSTGAAGFPAGMVYGDNWAEYIITRNIPSKIIFTNGNYLEPSGSAVGSWQSSGRVFYFDYVARHSDGTVFKDSTGVELHPFKLGNQVSAYLGADSQLQGDAGVWTAIGQSSDVNGGIYLYTQGKYYKSATGAVGYNNIKSDTMLQALKDFLSGAELAPYYGDISTTGGGNGTYEITNNPIDFAPLPTISAVTSGLISLYCPNAAQINDLANFLWSEDFFVNVAKTFNNPIDMIIGLSIFPITPPTVGAQEVKIGNIASTVTMNKIGQQFLTLDCGTIDVAEYWGSALDYAPFSKMSIFLPYIGTKELNIDDVMGKTIHLRYAIDLLTGSCNAELKCADSVLYSFTGSVNSPIPITGADWSGLTRSLISAVVGTGVAVATGGAGAAIAAGVAGAANSVINGKPNVQKTGAIAGTSGLLAQQTPYLIYELPRQSRAENYNATMGLPSNIYAKLDTLKGFTKLSKIHLEKIPATAAEAAEIEKLLYEGVIL